MIFNFNKQGTTEKVWEQVYLLLGSNLGNREGVLLNAAKAIENKDINIVSKSKMYETAAWGKTDQPAFLNQVLEVETTNSPQQLISILQKIELESGRERIEKWGPRIIDIDILYAGNEIIVEKDLKIPHPELQNRRFTLVPLVEIAGDFVHPVLNLTNKQLLERCQDQLEVKALGEI